MLILMISITAMAENSEKTDIEKNGYQIVLDENEVGKSYVYTGSELTPTVTVAKTDENGACIEESRLVMGTDYTVAYTNNTDAGDAKVIVTGCGEYIGTLEKTFTINKASLADAEIQLEQKSFIYDGTEKRPGITKILFNAKVLTTDNYQVTYADNVNAGTATAIVSASAESKNFTGSKEVVFTIEKASLADATITLPYKSYIYNGEYRKPVPTVKINGKTVKKDNNYQVTYTNHKNVGTATVKVTALDGGNLSGSKSITFKIIPKATSISLTRAYEKVKISWKKVSNVSGYEIYRRAATDSEYKRIKTVTSGSTLNYTDTNVRHNVKYYYKVRAYKTVNKEKVRGAFSAVESTTVRVAEAEIDKITRVDYKSLKITWDSVKGATGYRVYRSKSKNGTYNKVATLAGNSTESYTDTGLKCGRTYYYKVRAYRKIDGVKYFGSYSDAKSRNTRPSKVKLTGDSFYKSTKTTLNWKKSSGANGYEIYRSTSKNGTYKRVKTIKSQNTLTWTNTGLSKTKNYFYKVRAYCEVDGKKVYSVYSDIFRKTKAGWRYSTFLGNKIKYYYNADNERVKDVSNLIGKQDSYVIKVNKQRATVTVYAKDGDNGYIIPVKAFVCSPGWSTPVGTFRTQQKLRWHELMGPCWGQWNTRISGSYLFHSVFYNSYRNSDALSVNAYNKLGTVCSHGCVRLTAGDAKWIYDNCDLKTKVIIYNSSTSGPFGKPSAVKLPYWHTWDPTDPNKFAKCNARGCH